MSGHHHAHIDPAYNHDLQKEIEKFISGSDYYKNPYSNDDPYGYYGYDDDKQEEMDEMMSGMMSGDMASGDMASGEMMADGGHHYGYHGGKDFDPFEGFEDFYKSPDGSVHGHGYPPKDDDEEDDEADAESDEDLEVDIGDDDEFYATPHDSSSTMDSGMMPSHGYHNPAAPYVPNAPAKPILDSTYESLAGDVVADIYNAGFAEGSKEIGNDIKSDPVYEPIEPTSDIMYSGHMIPSADSIY